MMRFNFKIQSIEKNIEGMPPDTEFVEFMTSSFFEAYNFEQGLQIALEFVAMLKKVCSDKKIDFSVSTEDESTANVIVDIKNKPVVEELPKFLP